jgi:O-antigen/teichoic acid export membrane protein
MLVRNAVWNLAGQILPLIVAIAVIPLLLKLMGTEGFGLVAIVWTLIGYFSLFDFGLGRALTKYISVELDYEKPLDIADIVLTGMYLLAIIGVVVGVSMWFSAPWLVPHVLKVKQSDPTQTVLAFQLIAFAIPFVVINVGLRAILEGYLRFDLTNLIRLPFGVFTLGSPAIVASLGYDLPIIVLTLFVGIIIMMLAYIGALWTSTQGKITRGGRPLWSIAKKLLGFGGWVSLSNFIGPILFYIDRFVISAILSVAVMAYYVTPYEAITKTLFLSSAIAGSLFPVFAKPSNIQGTGHIEIMLTGARIAAMTMFTFVLITACFGYDLLDLWVGKEIAINGTLPLQILAVGVFFNAIAYMPYTLIQASGRADLVAKLHLAQLPVYVLAMWLSVSHWGLEGAAFVWLGRALLEMIIFFAWTSKMAPNNKTSDNLLVYVLCGAIGLAMAFGLSNSVISLRLIVLIMALILFHSSFWFWVLKPSDRLWVNSRLKLIFTPTNTQS